MQRTPSLAICLLVCAVRPCRGDGLLVVQPFHQRNVTSLALTPDGKTLASAGRDGIRVWDVAKGSLERQLPGHSVKTIWSIAERACTTGLQFANNGKMLVSSGGDGNIRTFDTDTGKLLNVVSEPWVLGPPGSFVGRSHAMTLRRVPIDAMAISADGSIVAACVFGTVRVWDLGSGRLLKSFGDTKLSEEILEVSALIHAEERGEFGISKAAFLHDLLHFPKSPDATFPGRLRRWRHSEPIFDAFRQIDITADKKNVITAGRHNVYVWSLATGEQLAVFEDSSCFALSSDSAIVATSSGSAPVRLWSVKSGKLLRTLDHGATCLQFSGNGRFLLTADRELIHVWDTDSWEEIECLPRVSEGGSPKQFVIAQNSSTVAAIWSGFDVNRVRVWSFGDRR